MRPVVAIVGRPNTGKSTLYNRLLGERKAVISEISGTTRDRLYGEVNWQGKEFHLVDTGGISFEEKDSLASNVQSQVNLAISEADLIIFLVDGREEVSREDLEAAKLIRKTDKPVILVANKIDDPRLRIEASKFNKFGLGEPVAISALHGIGTGDLLDLIIKKIKLPRAQSSKPKADEVSISIIGRPNVGKSSLLNKLLGRERVIVSEAPGTTRDAVDITYKYKDQNIKFVDTPGIRKRGKIEKGVEKYSVLRAIKSIEKADIVLLLVDATEGITKQDLHIAQYVLENYKGIILVVNKWDLVEAQSSEPKAQSFKSIENYLGYLRNKISFLPWAPVIFVSALTGKNVDKIFNLILDVEKEREKKIQIKKLNSIIAEAVIKRPPGVKFKLFKKRIPKIYYSTQIDINPPTFVLMVNFPELIHFSYLRYLENEIRHEFNFSGTPIKIVLRSKKEE